MSDNVMENKVSVELYQVTEDRIYDILGSSEQKEDWRRGISESKLMSELTETMGLPEFDLPEARPLSHADIVHFALVTYMVIAQLPESERMSVRAIKEIVNLMIDIDGIKLDKSDI